MSLFRQVRNSVWENKNVWSFFFSKKLCQSRNLLTIGFTGPKQTIPMYAVSRTTDKIERKRTNVSRSQLANDTGILFRDLRIVDPGFHDHNPVILVRPQALLLRLGYVSCIIKHDQIWLFQPENPYVVKVVETLWSELGNRKSKEKGSNNISTEKNQNLSCSNTTDSHQLEHAVSDYFIPGQNPSLTSLIHDGEMMRRQFAEVQANRIDFKASTEVGKSTSGQYDAGHAKICDWPFEFFCLEVTMQICLEGYENDFDEMRQRLNSILITDQELNSQNDMPVLPMTYLANMMSVKNDLQTLEMFISSLRVTVLKILKEDEDMAAMYLSEISSNMKRKVSDHDEVELLLESYLHRLDEIRSEVVTVKQKIANHEELIRISLDMSRNSIMQLNIRISLVSLTCSLAAVITGIFGMNLMSHMESNIYLFFFISFGVVLPLSICGLFGYNLLFRLFSKRLARKVPFHTNNMQFSTTSYSRMASEPHTAKPDVVRMLKSNHCYDKSLFYRSQVKKDRN